MPRHPDAHVRWSEGLMREAVDVARIPNGNLRTTGIVFRKADDVPRHREEVLRHTEEVPRLRKRPSCKGFRVSGQ